MKRRYWRRVKTGKDWGVWHILNHPVEQWHRTVALCGRSTYAAPFCSQEVYEQPKGRLCGHCVRKQAEVLADEGVLV